MRELVIERGLFRGPMDELDLLLAKIRDAEDFVARAEAYFKEHSADWSDGVAAYFEIFLERKREQIYHEQSLAEKMGWHIALDHYQPGLDV